jgi:hypothetical protein
VPQTADEQASEHDDGKQQEAERRAREIAGTTADPPLVPRMLLVKPNCSIAVAAASVTIAKLTPRTRSADTPVTNPSAVATATPQTAASGTASPASSTAWKTVKAATPASASWTSEICPTKPVITTNDMQITVPAIETVSALR